MKRPALKTLAKLALIAGLGVWLVQSGRFSLTDLKRLVDSLGLGEIAAVWGALGYIAVASAVRTRALFGFGGYTLPLTPSIRWFLVGLFFNNFLPGGVGGDLVRICGLKNDARADLIACTAVVFVERLLGLFALLFCALVLSAALLPQAPRVIALILAPAGLAATLLLLRSPACDRLFHRAAGRFPFLGKLDSARSVLQGLARNPVKLGGLLILNTTAHAAVFAAVGLIAAALNGPQAFTPVFLTTPAVLLSSAVPITPGNIGVTESVADLLFKLSQVEGGAAILLAWRVLCAAFSLLGAPAYLMAGKPGPPAPSD